MINYLKNIFNSITSSIDISQIPAKSAEAGTYLTEKAVGAATYGADKMAETGTYVASYLDTNKIAETGTSLATKAVEAATEAATYLNTNKEAKIAAYFVAAFAAITLINNSMTKKSEKSDTSVEQVAGEFFNMVKRQSERGNPTQPSEQALEMAGEFFNMVEKKDSSIAKISKSVKNGTSSIFNSLKNVVTSMMTRISKFGKFVFKTLPSRLYSTIFRSNTQKAHSVKLNPVLAELVNNSEKNEAAKKIQQFYRKVSEDTREVRFDEKITTSDTALKFAGA